MQEPYVPELGLEVPDVLPADISKEANVSKAPLQLVTYVEANKSLTRMLVQS